VGQPKDLVLTMLRPRYNVSRAPAVSIDLYDISDKKTARDMGSVLFENGKLAGASARRATLRDGTSIDEVWSALLAAFSSLESSSKNMREVFITCFWFERGGQGTVTLTGQNSAIAISYVRGDRNGPSHLLIDEEIKAVPANER
jgi:hypothetical protein